MPQRGFKKPRLNRGEYKAIKILLETRPSGLKRQTHIARKVGRTKQTINRINLSKSYAEYKRENDPRLKGGEYMSIKRTNNPWRKEQVFMLLGMTDAGNHNDEIGKVLERTPGAIQQLKTRIKLYRAGVPSKDRINLKIYDWVNEYYSVPRVAGVARAVLQDRPIPTVSVVSQDPLDKLDSAIDSLKSIIADVIVAETEKRIEAEREQYRQELRLTVEKYEKKVADLEVVKEEARRSSVKGLILNRWKS